MDAIRFDAVAKLFAKRRHAQEAPGRQAPAQGSAGPAAAQTQDAAGLAAPPGAETGPTMLFLQAIKAGSVAPKGRHGAEGRYTLTLERGLGHIVYFSDRPHRVVLATPTPQFLAGLGFPDDNPPNAAWGGGGGEGDEDRGAGPLRPSLDDARSHLRTGDALAVWRLDRLGRSLKHLIQVVGALQQRGIGFRSVTEQIDTTTPGGKLVSMSSGPSPSASAIWSGNGRTPNWPSRGPAGARAGGRKSWRTPRSWRWGGASTTTGRPT
jgi:hypothetical protein